MLRAGVNEVGVALLSACVHCAVPKENLFRFGIDFMHGIDFATACFLLD